MVTDHPYCLPAQHESVWLCNHLCLCAECASIGDQLYCGVLPEADMLVTVITCLVCCRDDRGSRYLRFHRCCCKDPCRVSPFDSSRGSAIHTRARQGTRAPTHPENMSAAQACCDHQLPGGRRISAAVSPLLQRVCRRGEFLPVTTACSAHNPQP